MEETIITSVQNARIKHVVALQQKSSLRREEGLFVVEGQREIEHCIACGYEIQELFVLDSLNYTGSITPTLVSHQVYEKMAYRESTEGIIAVAKAKDHSLATLNASLFTPNASPTPLIVVLESVEKPGNLGAILRTAEAAGVDAVIVCDPLTDLYNPNLIRASIGGVFSVPVAVCDSKACIAFGAQDPHPYGSAAGLLRLLRLQHAGRYCHRDGYGVDRTYRSVARGCRCAYPHSHVGSSRLAECQRECCHPDVRGRAPTPSDLQESNYVNRQINNC